MKRNPRCGTDGSRGSGRRGRVRPAAALAALAAALATVLVVSCATVAPSGARVRGVSPGPSDPLATENTRALLDWLYGLETRESDRLVSGQEIGPADAEHGYDFWVEGLAELTGSKPALIALDYYGGTNDPYPLDVARKNAVLARHWREGGLVSVYHNFGNPWTGGSSRDMTVPEGSSYSDAYTPGTRANARLRRDLDFTADQFLLLQEQGVVVVYRPYHEMNRDAFWWHSPHPAEFVELWRYTVRYLTEDRGVHNVLYFFSPGSMNEIDLQQFPPHVYYPGDDAVDIVGLDLYEEDPLAAPRANYTKTAATGKLFAFGELGGRLPPTPANRNWNLMQIPTAVRASYRDAVMWLSWSSWYPNGVMGMVELPGAVELFRDPWVADLADLDFEPPVRPQITDPIPGRADAGGARVGSLIFGSGNLTGVPGPWESGLASLEAEGPQRLPVSHVRLTAVGHVAHALDRLIDAEECSVVLIGDRGYARETILAYARRYPDVDFVVDDTSLLDAPDNVSTFGINLEGWFYLIGVIAGATTATDTIGYVARSEQPWDVEHANEFALGVREVNARARILHVVAEDTAAAVRMLAGEGCDVFNDVANEPSVMLELRELREEGRSVAAFSAVIAREDAPDVIRAGSPVDMGAVFRRLIREAVAARRTGSPPNRPLWLSITDGVVLIDAGRPDVDAATAAGMKALLIDVPGLGRVSSHELLVARLDQLASGAFVLPERSAESLSPEFTAYRAEPR